MPPVHVIDDNDDDDDDDDDSSTTNGDRVDEVCDMAGTFTREDPVERVDQHTLLEEEVTDPRGSKIQEIMWDVTDLHIGVVKVRMDTNTMRIIVSHMFVRGIRGVHVLLAEIHFSDLDCTRPMSVSSCLTLPFL
jgi:hypothetical protein